MRFYHLYTNNLKILWPSKCLALYIPKSDSGQGRIVQSALIYILLCNATSVSLYLMGPRALDGVPRLSFVPTATRDLCDLNVR